MRIIDARHPTTIATVAAAGLMACLGACSDSSQHGAYKNLPEACDLVDQTHTTRLVGKGAAPTPSVAPDVGRGNKQTYCTFAVSAEQGSSVINVGAHIVATGDARIEKSRKSFAVDKPNDCDRVSSTCRSVTGIGDEAYMQSDDTGLKSMHIVFREKNIEAVVQYLGFSGAQKVPMSSFESDGVELARSVARNLRAKAMK